VPNKSRTSNCGRVTAKIVYFTLLKSEVTRQKFTTLSQGVAESSPCNLYLQSGLTIGLSVVKQQKK